MKRISAVALVFSMLLCAGCAEENVLPAPENNPLEYWITEKITEEEIRRHYQLDDLFGGYAFYGVDYLSPADSGSADAIVPEEYVLYYVTSYPDYSSNGGAFDTITRIVITDPAVEIYGVHCNSSPGEFDFVFESLGCEITEGTVTRKAVYGKSTICLTVYEGGSELSVSVEVSNRNGIDF